MSTRTIETPIGLLTLQADEAAVTAIRFGATARRTSHPCSTRAEAQLREYFAARGGHSTCRSPRAAPRFSSGSGRRCAPSPTARRARMASSPPPIGSPSASRAVGMANHHNPTPIVIPCHRVIGANGTLTGYAGGLEIKRKLLALEGITILK